MQFNDTTNLNGLIQACETWSGIGIAGISGDTNTLKLFTRLINANYEKVVSMILESMDEESYDDPNWADSGYILTKNLVGGTRKITLAVSDKIMKIQRVEISYDNSSWYKASPLADGQYGLAFNDPSVDKNFNANQPYYYQHGFDLYLYPAPSISVTGGLKIYTVREIDEFTSADTTQVPGISIMFHDMIAVGACLDYCISHGKEMAGSLAQRFADYEARLRRYYGSRNEDRHLVIQPADQDYV